MGMPEINQVLTHLAVEKKVAAFTQNQALSVVVFLINSLFISLSMPTNANRKLDKMPG